jgi:GMP synthase (glutamine-hydrolysing)
MKKNAVALTHVTFEDLGSFAPVLSARGYDLHYREACSAPWRDPLVESADLLIILGGPIGVYEEESYPFLTEEIALVRRRLAAQQPTLGLCLGSQIMAAALSARVYPGGRKEIGWKNIQLTPAGQTSPLRHLADVPVLHWHGDTFDLPADATWLAQSDLYPHQAFTLGHHGLALQFHPEVTALGLERWFIGHALEIATTPGLDVSTLRTESQKHAPALAQAATACLNDWLDQLV